MPRRLSLCTALALYTALIATPAAAADGEILLTQTRAMQGGITPGDAPGFPITLTQPGSYKFASNITPPPGRDGIETSEADITIDLNGFRLHGMGVAHNGIRDTGSYGHPSVTIRNGTVAGFSQWGISGFGHSWIVEHMRVTVNGLNGVGISGDAARIVNSTITANGRSGVICFRFCQVESNVLVGNGMHGVEMGSGSIINNTIADNRSEGIYKVDVGGRGSIGYANNSIYGARSILYQIRSETPLQPMHPNYCPRWCTYDE